MWRTKAQTPEMVEAEVDPDLGRGEPVDLLAAVEQQLQRADGEREHGEAEEVEAALPLLGDRGRKTIRPASARMPTGRLTKKTQRQLKVSVSQPPRVGPMIGPTMIPAPQIAIAGRAPPWS